MIFDPRILFQGPSKGRRKKTIWGNMLSRTIRIAASSVEKAFGKSKNCQYAPFSALIHRTGATGATGASSSLRPSTILGASLTRPSAMLDASITNKPLPTWNIIVRGINNKVSRYHLLNARHQITSHHFLQALFTGRPRKTKKAAAKRFKLTGKGKIKRGHSGKRHLTSHMTRVRMRRLNKSSIIPPSSQRSKNIRKMLNG
jgi:large subunit ribosomal protein L35